MNFELWLRVPLPRALDDDGKTVPNVVIIGNTGIGKSYYANGIMGGLNPDTGFFGTSGSDISCTRGVKGVSGQFYGGRLTHYDVEPMLVNFYDTPGFADSDPCQIEKNKERIVAALKNPIHAFIFLTDHLNSRIDANQQELFNMLNEWTMGHIWNNLIVGYPRMTFDHNDRMNRIDKDTSYYKDLDAKKEVLKKTLWTLASKGGWKKRDQNDRLVPMKVHDFDNIKVNALNVHQNTVCLFNDDGRVDTRNSDLSRCNQLAIFDESLDYITTDDTASDNQYRDPFAMNSRFTRRKYHLEDDRWVFIEEARKLQHTIKDFSRHPVPTQTVYWREKYYEEEAAYKQRWSTDAVYGDKWGKTNQGIFQAFMDASQRIENRFRADADFCYNIENKYKPFGFEAPEGLECQMAEEHTAGCSLQNPQQYDSSCESTMIGTILMNGLPNVLILGETGIGKSYFANGIMGSLDPNTGFFGTSDSLNPCTNAVSGVSGWFYGRKLKSYNLEPMFMNVFDTPGFDTTDPCQIEKNKERISDFLDKPIHAVIFLVDNSYPRMDANQQKLLKLLNDWSMGHIWNNFVVVNPRMTFDHFDRINRIDSNTSFLKELNAKKEDFKKTLWKLASEQGWKKLNDNGQLSFMEMHDFDNIKVNGLNVHQNNVCAFTDAGRIDTINSDLDQCKQLAVFDESLDYIMTDDTTSNNQDRNPFEMNPFEINPFSTVDDGQEYDIHEDKWVFIEEAKKLQHIIKDFAKHPFISEKHYWGGKYAEELAAYSKRKEEPDIQINSDAFKSPEIDLSQCEEERNRRESEIQREKERALRRC